MAVDSLKAIYVGLPVSPVDQQSISLLQEGLRRLYGVNLPIISDPSKVAQARGGIVLGASAALASGAVRPEELDATWPEGHVYKAGDGRIVIAGKMGWDTYFGVVTFLESQGGQVPGGKSQGSQMARSRQPPDLSGLQGR